MFNKYKERKIAENVCNLTGISYKSFFELYSLDNKNIKKIEKLFIAKRAEKFGFAYDDYLHFLDENINFYYYQALNKNIFPEKNKLNEDDYKKYVKFSLENFLHEEDLLSKYRAIQLNLPLEEYELFKNRDDKNDDLLLFLQKRKAASLNMTLDEYFDYIEAKKLGLTLKEYQDVRIAQNMKLSINQYYCFLYLNLFKDLIDEKYIDIAAYDELFVSKMLGFKKIRLLPYINNYDVDPSLFSSFNNIVYAPGLTKLFPCDLTNLKCSTLIIPPINEKINIGYLNIKYNKIIKRVIFNSAIDINSLDKLEKNIIYYIPEKIYNENIIFNNYENIFSFRNNKNADENECCIIENERTCYLYNGVKKEKDFSFLDDYNIYSIIIPEDMDYINDDAFSKLKNVKNIIVNNDKISNLILHNSIRFFNNKSYNVSYLFKSINLVCDNTLIIDNNVDKIEDYEFMETRFEALVIHKGVKYIGKRAFFNSNIKIIEFNGSTKYADNSFEGCAIKQIIQKTPFIKNDKSFENIEIETLELDGISIIKKNAFTHMIINNLEIPNSISKVEKNAFKVRHLKINHTFSINQSFDSTLLESVDFNNVSNEFLSDFFEITYPNLKQIILPSTISLKIFEKICISHNLKIIKAHKEIMPLCEDCGELTIEFPSTLMDFELPLCVLGINEKVFKNGFGNIINLILPSHIIYLPLDSYFEKMKKNTAYLNNLKKSSQSVLVNFHYIKSHEVTSITKPNLKCSSEIIMNWDKTNKDLFNLIETYEQTIPNELCINSIDELFSLSFDIRTRVKKIKLGSKFEEIPNFAFAFMYNLEEVKFDGLLKVLGDYCFFNCIKLHEINISPTVQLIGVSAFENNYSLECISGFDSLVCVKKDAFKNCYKLKSLVFNSCLEKVDDCISGCTNFEKFVLISNLNMLNLKIESSNVSLYLPRVIDELNIKSAFTCTVHCLRGVKWKDSKYNFNYIYYNIYDYQKKIKELIIPYGFVVDEIGMKKVNNNQVSYNISNNFNNYEINNSFKTYSRASFDIKEEKTVDLTFNNVATNVNEIIDKGQIKNSIYAINKVDRIKGNGVLEVINFNNKIEFKGKNIVTNNIFLISFDIECNYNTIYLCLINAKGESISDLIEIDNLSDKNNHIEITIELYNNVSNDKYYLIIASSNVLENNIIFRKEIEVNIAFSLDDFDF